MEADAKRPAVSGNRVTAVPACLRGVPKLVVEADASGAQRRIERSLSS